MAAKKKNLQTEESSVDLLPVVARDEINIVWDNIFYSAKKDEPFAVPFGLYDHLAGLGKIAGVPKITEVD